ncbi:OXA1-like protein [Ophiocordyceps sinensis CO18]|uniref:OXA1-like protein n=1 Tax=Ophiocordyceps sinensis (strain Co18 / CGMCC 3.14243) TaxID=911162 RepID=T5ADF5_OPHSC|nr:OXA1-like protein [Ophiocordyceps sinensis CO18]
MLPSRGIARSLPSAGVGRRLHDRRAATPSSTGLLSTRTATVRQFGTVLRISNAARSSSGPSPLLTGRHAVAPLLLGGISTPRAFSLWGFGKSNTPPAPADAAAAETMATATDTPAQAATTAAPAVRPVDPTPEAPLTEPLVPASDVDLWSIADLVDAKEILAMPEQLGYLHAIGLDYNWGPSSIMQWTLEHVHVWTGLGWGASIVATAFALRVVMFYPQVRALQFGALMQKMKQDPRSHEAMKLIQQGYQDRDMETRHRGQILNKMLRDQYGVSNWGMLWSIMQVPFAFGMFRVVSGMTHIPVPSLETGGYLWFPDLTLADPSPPAVGTGLMILSVLLNAKHGPPSQQKMLKPMMFLFGIFGFFCTTFLSSAVNLMTVAVGASTLVSALVLSNTRLRRFFDLPTYDSNTPPKPPVSLYAAPRAAPIAEPAEPAPPTGLRERLSNNIGDVKKGISEQVSNLTGTYAGTAQEKAARRRKDLLRNLESTRKSQEREEFVKKYKKQ